MKPEVHQALEQSGLMEASRRKVREWAAEKGKFGVILPGDLAEQIRTWRAFEETQAATPQRVLRQDLEAAFFGTVMPRDPESGIARYRHAQDGWRSGVSHPFRATVSAAVLTDENPKHRMLFRIAGVTAAGVATFDVLEDPTWTLHQYTLLRAGIEAGTITPA